MVRVVTLEARGLVFKYQPRQIQSTLYFVLEPPDVIPLLVDQGLSSLEDCWLLKLDEGAMEHTVPMH